MLLANVISWYFRKRMPQLEDAMLRAVDIQHQTLQSLMKSAQDTWFGKQHNFAGITSYDKFRETVPVNFYEDLKPLIERNMNGEQNLLWPGEITWFAKSSGTTSDKSKFIPVSYETLDAVHFQGGRDVLTLYCNAFPDNKLFSGKGLVIGGSQRVNSLNTQSHFGDLSAVLMSNLPFWVNFLRTPDLSIALMEDWEVKLERMARTTMDEEVTNISGVPTWTLLLMQRILELKGKESILEVWPSLELYIHGGVSFAPYREQFKKLVGDNSSFHFMETYNASEGFFGIQDNFNSNDLLLMVNYGIFYEFIPLDEFSQGEYKNAVSLDGVKTGVNYAMIISNNSGLWRYVLGDTVKFSSTNPYRFSITGRTKHFINAFGEELVIENAEKALAHACELTSAEIRDYTAAPIYFSQGSAGHEWLIEFEKTPSDISYFTSLLDKELKNQNSDYEAKRHKDIALKPPVVHVLKDGTFYSWLKQKGKLGGQHKIPRLSNNRDVIEEILRVV